MSRGYTLLWSDKSLRRYECADEKWYRGTAGAIFQNLDLIDDLDEHLVALEEEGRPTQAIGSMIWGGCVLSGGVVPLLGARTSRPRPKWGFVEDSIVLDNCIIGLQCRIRRAILDENVTLGDGVSVGYKLEQDRACYHVTETGIVVVTSRTANSISSPASTASAAGLS